MSQSKLYIQHHCLILWIGVHIVYIDLLKQNPLLPRSHDTGFSDGSSCIEGQSLNFVSVSLLDKVMSHNQWHIEVQKRHLMFKDPYMVIKRRCDWNKTFPLGQFMPHLTTFIMFIYIYICQMTTKAMNWFHFGQDL